MHNKIFILAFTSLVLLWGCTAEKSQSGPEGISELYWQAILSGDSESANKLVIEDIDLELSQMIQPGSNSQVTFVQADVDDGIATVATHLAWVDGDKEVLFAFDTKLEQIDSEWKIDADTTQQNFFKSVYDYSLTDDGIQLLPQPTNDDTLSPQELNAMLDELERTSKELQSQQEVPPDEVEAFLELMDDDLREKITE